MSDVSWDTDAEEELAAAISAETGEEEQEHPGQPLAPERKRKSNDARRPGDHSHGRSRSRGVRRKAEAAVGAGAPGGASSDGVWGAAVGAREGTRDKSKPGVHITRQFN